MSTRATTFDDLATELLLCICDYLPLADQYYAFFDYNNRLRLLIKHWTVIFIKKTLRDDLYRFTVCHCCIQRENFGTKFYIIPAKGQYAFHVGKRFYPSIIDPFNIHWHCFKQIPKLDPFVSKIIAKYPIELNPFNDLGRLDMSREYFHAYPTIVLVLKQHRISDENDEWLRENYSDIYTKVKNWIKQDNDDDYQLKQYLIPLFKNEYQKQYEQFYNNVQQICNDLEQLKDINILNIYPWYDEEQKRREKVKNKRKKWLCI
ncbi:unnamed protein product [Didymodactylos carnosus]|uniref:Uncharacterized protein n=1 Tax=Didymodactylos carnosus TaxID=1234261 RepID=A0A815XIZ9_9BILA|nr:unnamed protein product [Didymodactylos carnosus]CAF1560939.1 unnamed protein product [Didymodactylos carnosus]CAF4352690.1 unnamed protein product [Didymodactylos carnosus]CAF4419398.1 unnamed protein product [Didymodactylos carnosus]